MKIARGLSNAMPKRQKLKDTRKRPVVFVAFNPRRGKPKPVLLKALLDSGASSTIVSSKYVQKLKKRDVSKASEWTTLAGTFKTKGTVQTNFYFPEFHDGKLIEWKMHVSENMGAYDMIIGRDLLEDLGIDLKFSTSMVEWDGVEIPFKDIEASMVESFYIREPDWVLEELFKAEKILDNDYAKADIAQVTNSQKHLSKEERQKLKCLFEKFESLFDGTLGAWTHDNYHLELKEGVKPYHARAFPVLKVHYDTLKKEVK